MKCDCGEIRLFTIQSTVSINQGSPDGKGGFLLVYQSKAGSKYGIVVLFSYAEAIWMKVKNVTWGEWKCLNTSEILSNLTTTNKSSLVGAINELNSNRLTGLAVKTNEKAILPIHVYSSALILGTVNSNVFGFYLVSRGETESIYITPLTKNSKSDDFTITPIDAYKVSIQTKINTEMKVIY